MRLIGDIGGTNARFALACHGRYERLSTYPSEDFSSLEDCIAAYLSEHAAEKDLDSIALAVAGPVAGESVRLTNHPWRFSRQGLGKRFGVARVELFNDFTANALSLPHLKSQDLEPIGCGTSLQDGPKAVLGPGTGLGVSGLLKAADEHWLPIEGEGGHATLAAATARESAILDVLRRRYDHVSAERVLSGDGLVNIYEALCEIEGRPSAGYRPAQITDEALAEADPICHETIAIFCAVLGTVAGNLALTLGALGGVYIAGGIVPRLGPRFARSGFRSRFESKGRMQDYLARIPTFLITHKSPALVGLASLP